MLTLVLQRSADAGRRAQLNYLKPHEVFCRSWVVSPAGVLHVDRLGVIIFTIIMLDRWSPLERYPRVDFRLALLRYEHLP